MFGPIPSSPIKGDPNLQQLLEVLDSRDSYRQFQLPRTETIKAAPRISNPIKDDPKLQQLLKKLDSVIGTQQFQRWRNSFLKEFDAFLDDPDKTARAKLVFSEFGANLAKLTKLLKHLQGFLENGDLAADTCTVKARQCLTELGRQTTVVILQMEALVPGTSAEEKKAGYTKFNVGAALIRDGFVQYGRLLACTEVLEYLRTKTCLEEVADRQILQEMELYGVKASIFCDVMADLGIVKVMTRCRELDVMEVDDSAGELKPYELENEAPASPHRPKKSPTKPQTPQSSKSPKKAKIPNYEKLIALSIPDEKSGFDKSEKAVSAGELKPYELENEAPASPRRPKKSPTKPQTPQSSKSTKKAKIPNYEKLIALTIPAEKSGFDESEKAVRARRIGTVDGSNPAEERRKEEDQYKPIERMNLKSYYHGSDGPSPFHFLNKKRKEKDDSSSSSDEEEPSKPKEKESEQGKEEEKGDGGGIDKKKRQEPREESESEDDAGDEGAPDDATQPSQKENVAKNAENQWTFVPRGLKRSSPMLGTVVPEESLQPAQKENQPRNSNSKERSEDGAPDESPKPLQKSALANEDEEKVDPDIDDRKKDDDDEPPDDKGNYGDDVAPVDPLLIKNALADEDEDQEEPDVDGNDIDDRDDNDEEVSKVDAGDDQAPGEPLMPTSKRSKSQESKRLSADSEDGDGIFAENQERVQKGDKSKSGMRPSTMRGASFGDDNGGGIPENPQKPVQKADKPKSDMRPSTMRGASFGDNDGGGMPGKPREPRQKANKPMSDMRPSAMRRASFGDNDGGGVPENSQEPSQKVNKTKSDMRPLTMRGASSGDQDGSGIPDKPQEPPEQTNKSKSILRPSIMRKASSGDEDGCGVPDRLHEPMQKAIKTQSGVELSYMRWHLFRDGDGDGAPCSPVRRAENQSIDLASIKDDEERNAYTGHLAKQILPAKIPIDDNAQGIECTPNYHNPAAFTTTENNVDVKSRAVQSAAPEKKNAEDRVKREKCYMWYARMSQPNLADMKRRVANLPESCGITVADVDELPWMPGGKILSIPKMNKLFLGDD